MQPRSQGFSLEGALQPSRKKPWERGCWKMYIEWSIINSSNNIIDDDNDHDNDNDNDNDY